LSLLAFFGGCCVWWRSYYVADEVFMTTSDRTFIQVSSTKGLAGMTCAANWPALERFSREAQYYSGGEPNTGPFLVFVDKDAIKRWHYLGLKGSYGTMHTVVGPDGIALKTWPQDGDFTNSDALSTWSIYVPEWMLASLTMLPSLIWVARYLFRKARQKASSRAVKENVDRIERSEGTVLLTGKRQF
jgi:hypothetical protein